MTDSEILLKILEELQTMNKLSYAKFSGGNAEIYSEAKQKYIIKK